jgi:hypothetical protein
MAGEKVKEGWAAFVAGAGIICYAVIILVTAFISISKFQYAHLFLIGLGIIMLMLGIGLIRRNFHAWLITTIIASIKVLSGFISLFVTGYQGGGQSHAPQMIWPLIYIYLLYLSRKECTIKTFPWSKEERTKLAQFIKSHLPEITALTATMITAIAGFHWVGGVMIFIGLPILAFEFAIIYLLGSYVSKRQARKVSSCE